MTLKQPLSLGTLDNHIGSSGIYLMIDSSGLFATDASQLQSTACEKTHIDNMCYLIRSRVKNGAPISGLSEGGEALISVL
jgi:precorrin-6x reductase